MKKSIKITSLILVLVMAVACLAACGNASTSAGKTDATTGDNTNKSTVKTINIPLTDELYAFGVSKDDQDLIKSVNSFISKIKKDGTFEAILDKYFKGGKPEGVTSAAEDTSKDQLVVATNAEFAPFEYLDGDTFYGVDMEIAKLLAKELGKELVIKNVDFEAVCQTVGSGYADIAMAGLTINEDRKEFVTFSDSYYTASQYIIAPANNTTFDNCKTAADVEKLLSGMNNSIKIGVQTGTTAEYYVEGDESWGFAGFKVTCKGYNSGALAVQDLINGNIQYVIIDQAPAESIVASVNAVN